MPLFFSPPRFIYFVWLGACEVRGWTEVTKGRYFLRVALKMLVKMAVQAKGAMPDVFSVEVGLL